MAIFVPINENGREAIFMAKIFASTFQLKAIISLSNLKYYTIKTIQLTALIAPTYVGQVIFRDFSLLSEL